MISRSDITDSEFVFLVSQKILISQLYDARGQAATAWGDDAKRLGFMFGLSTPCHQGHRLRTRAGHCIQCDTSRIAFARRYGDPGYVYLAASKKEKLLKIGSCIDTDQRLRNLNYQSYGGANDWEIIAWSKTSSMGQMEFDIHKTLADISIEKVYNKDGRKQVARELFKYEIVRVWQVYKDRTSKLDEKAKWKHPKLTTFAKV